MPQHSATVDQLVAGIPDVAKTYVISDYWLLLAEGHLTRRLFGAMVGRIRCPCQPGRRRPDRIPAMGEAGGGKVSETRVERGAVAVFGSRERHEWHLPRPPEAPCTANPAHSWIRRRPGRTGLDNGNSGLAEARTISEGHIC